MFSLAKHKRHMTWRSSLRLSQSFNIEEDSIEGTTTEVHDVDMREPLDDDTNMDIDEEIPADFRRRSLSVTADDRPRGQSNSFVPEDENIRSDEAQVTASGSESQPLSPRFEGERSDVIDMTLPIPYSTGTMMLSLPLPISKSLSPALGGYHHHDSTRLTKRANGRRNHSLILSSLLRMRRALRKGN